EWLTVMLLRNQQLPDRMKHICEASDELLKKRQEDGLIKPGYPACVHLASRLALPCCGIIVDRVRHHNARAGRPTQGTWTWRSCDGAGSMCGGLDLGGHCCQIGARPRGFLAGCDAALLRP